MRHSGRGGTPPASPRLRPPGACSRGGGRCRSERGWPRPPPRRYGPGSARAKQRVLARDGALDQVGPAVLQPFLRAGAVAHRGIDVFGLHQVQGLARAQIVPRPAQAHLLHGLQRHGVVVHLDAAHAAHAGADHVVVHQQRLEAVAQQRGVHTHALIDHVEARKSRHHIGHAALIARLHVHLLGIGHGAGRAAGQVVIARHLAAGGREQALFGRPAGHRAGAQVGNEGPCAENGRVAGLHGVDVDHAREAFGHRLHHGAGQRRRRGRARLAGREQQDGHAAAHQRLHHKAALGGEFHRRHDEAVGIGDEGPLAPRRLGAGHHAQHLQPQLRVAGDREGGADMLGRPRHAGVERVEVHILRLDRVARGERSLEEMDVVERVGNARGIVEVLHRRLAVLARGGVVDEDGRARGAEMDAVAAGPEIVLRVLAVERDVAGGQRQHVLHQRRREADAPVAAQHRAGRCEDLRAAGRRVGEPHLLQRPQGGAVDAVHVGLRERAVGPALHARPHRAHVLGQRRGARGLAGGPSAGAAAASGGSPGSAGVGHGLRSLRAGAPLTSSRARRGGRRAGAARPRRRRARRRSRSPRTTPPAPGPSRRAPPAHSPCRWRRPASGRNCRW